MRIPVVPVLMGFASSIAVAQQSDVPLTNWTVPPYSSSSGGLTTMTDATPPRAFVGIQPCRVADTRGNGAPIQGGIFPNGGLRTWDLTGICGIPAGAEAISANFTVTGSPSAPPGAFLLAWPTGGPVPPVSILNFQAGQTLANAAIVPLGAGEQINVNVSHSTHVIMDVNGYFSDTLQNAGNSFKITSASAEATLIAENTSTGADVAAIKGVITSTSAGDFATGVFGRTNGNGYGVHGSSANGYGVIAGGGAGGVYATTGGAGSGVYGQNTGTTAGAAGVFGQATGTAGNIFGGKFTTASTYNGAAGVKGVSGYGAPFGDATGSWGSAGVAGYDNSSSGGQGNGVLGFSTGTAVAGILWSGGFGVTQAEGFLGYRDGATRYGVLSRGGEAATGVKSFVDPHPTNPSKAIRYVTLEGPESGTYFRGRAQFQRGIAKIQVPEDFRMVTDAEGLSIQVTAIGQMATVAVVRIGLDEIIVRGSRDVEFFYLVNGVRRAFKDFQTIGDSSVFVPSGANAKLPEYLSEPQKRLLIQNGTYREDGTVNMETARRLGWDKEWKKREPPTPQPTSE